MNETLHITTTVLPGGRIVVEDPGLSEGDEVHVAVSPATPKAGRSAMQILADSPGTSSFENAEQVDDYIQKERDSWRN